MCVYLIRIVFTPELLCALMHVSVNARVHVCSCTHHPIRAFNWPHVKLNGHCRHWSKNDSSCFYTKYIHTSCLHYTIQQQQRDEEHLRVPLEVTTLKTIQWSGVSATHLRCIHFQMSWNLPVNSWSPVVQVGPVKQTNKQQQQHCTTLSVPKTGLKCTYI